jgi:hypothetical protein
MYALQLNPALNGFDDHAGATFTPFEVGVMARSEPPRLWFGYRRLSTSYATLVVVD